MVYKSVSPVYYWNEKPDIVCMSKQTIFMNKYKTYRVCYTISITIPIDWK